MAKINNCKIPPNKVMLRKIVICLLIGIMWISFVPTILADLYFYFNKDEIEHNYINLLSSVQGITLPGDEKTLAEYMKVGFKSKTRVSATGNFVAIYDAKSIITYYRKELLSHGWSELIYEKNINKSTGEHLSNIYEAKKGNYVIHFSFANNIDEPSNIYSEFKGLKKVTRKTKYQIELYFVDEMQIKF